MQDAAPIWLEYAATFLIVAGACAYLVSRFVRRKRRPKNKPDVAVARLTAKRPPRA